MSGIFVPKNYQNLIIAFQVTVENVGDVFLETQCTLQTVVTAFSSLVVSCGTFFDVFVFGDY